MRLKKGSMSAKQLEDVITLLGMDRRAFADQLGVHEGTLYRYLAGRQPIPLLVQNVALLAVRCQRLERKMRREDRMLDHILKGAL